jgi:hypothetical protein
MTKSVKIAAITCLLLLAGYFILPSLATKYLNSESFRQDLKDAVNSSWLARSGCQATFERIDFRGFSRLTIIGLKVASQSSELLIPEIKLRIPLLFFLGMEREVTGETRLADGGHVGIKLQTSWRSARRMALTLNDVTFDFLADLILRPDPSLLLRYGKFAGNVNFDFTRSEGVLKGTVGESGLSVRSQGKQAVIFQGYPVQLTVLPAKVTFQKPIHWRSKMGAMTFKGEVKIPENKFASWNLEATAAGHPLLKFAAARLFRCRKIPRGNRWLIKGPLNAPDCF